jgi:hypothetical protein
VGNVAAYDGHILQRRRTVSTLLYGNAGPGRSGAGGNRHRGALERLPETRLARMAIAPNAFRYCCPTSLHHYDEDWSYWVALIILGLCLISVVGLVALRLRPRLKVSPYSTGAVAVGILALLVAPTIWAAYTTWQGSGRRATAGPQTVQGSSWGGPGSGPRGGSWGGDNADPVLMDYLQANRGDAKYLVATANARSASPIILNTDEPDPVITFGGFGGRDPVLDTDQLTNLIDKRAVRFFLIQGREDTSESQQQSTSQNSPPWGEGPQNKSASWVQDNCEQVPKELWQSASSTADQDGGRGPWGMRAQMLYDCGAGRR